MSQKLGWSKPSREAVREICRSTQKQFSAEEKIQILTEYLLGKDRIAKLCQHEVFACGIYLRSSRDFLQTCKQRPAGDLLREATSTT